MSTHVSAISDRDVPRVAQFLHTHLNRRVSADLWARCIDVPWAVDRPNAGFMLVDEETVVGAQLAFYSERIVEGHRERFCNLGAWCVLPGYRSHSLRLPMALLAQEGYHFTDLTPTSTVAAVNVRLGFRFLDTTTAVLPNLPLPSRPGRNAITSDPELIERTLTGSELQLYRDHVAARGAHHALLTRGAEWCYVIFRRFRRRGVPLAYVLHVSDPALFVRMARPFGRHLLLRHRTVAMLAEDRVVGRRPPRSLTLPTRPLKMYRSSRLGPAHIDDLYSELVCQPW